MKENKHPDKPVWADGFEAAFSSLSDVLTFQTSDVFISIKKERLKHLYGFFYEAGYNHAMKEA
jgi:hypothetical protein